MRPENLAAKKMDKFISLMNLYVLGFFSAINAYCDWAESQAKNQTGLLVWGLIHTCLFGMAHWMLPSWLGKTIVLAFLPPLYAIFVVLRAYAWRSTFRSVQ